MWRVSGSLCFGFNLLAELVICVTECYGYDIIYHVILFQFDFCCFFVCPCITFMNLLLWNFFLVHMWISSDFAFLLGNMMGQKDYLCSPTKIYKWHPFLCFVLYKKEWTELFLTWIFQVVPTLRIIYCQCLVPFNSTSVVDVCIVPILPSVISFLSLYKHNLCALHILKFF